MDLTLFGSLTLLSLLISGFGIVKKSQLFIVAGLVSMMLISTALADEGLSYASGKNITGALTNSSTEITTYTTEDNWLTQGIARVTFLSSFFALAYYLIQPDEEPTQP